MDPQLALVLYLEETIAPVAKEKAAAYVGAELLPLIGKKVYTFEETTTDPALPKFQVAPTGHNITADQSEEIFPNVNLKKMIIKWAVHCNSKEGSVRDFSLAWCVTCKC